MFKILLIGFKGVKIFFILLVNVVWLEWLIIIILLFSKVGFVCLLIFVEKFICIFCWVIVLLGWRWISFIFFVFVFFGLKFFVVNKVWLIVLLGVIKIVLGLIIFLIILILRLFIEKFEVVILVNLFKLILFVIGI